MDPTQVLRTDIEIHKKSQLSDFVSLLKTRVMSLVVFTAFVGLYLAPGEIHPFIAVISIVCVVIGSGASGAINMWIERETDAKMKRTANRPLPAGRVDPDTAIEFAVIMAFASVFIMGIAVGPLAALLLLGAITFYVFVYTIWLKPRTPQNIVIGGAAGAIPPMIGWASVTGQVGIEAITLFLIIFMWTPPHFWALSLYKCKDYANAGIPMLPVTHGKEHTKFQILIYSLLLFPVTLLPYTLEMSSYIYGIGALLTGLKFNHLAYIVYKSSEDEEKPAKILFGYSIVYLFVLFSLLIIDKAILGQLCQ